jgi:LysM repeat protein
MALAKVAADKRHLVDSQGFPFFALGVNYNGYFDRAWKMWEPNLFDPALITTDFRKAKDSGFNCLRLFVHAALENDIRRNDFSKLDQVLSIAQDQQLKVLLTFNDAHSLNLSRVSEVDVQIVKRYRDVPTIIAYDLENEPVFYNLVAAIYPSGYQAPVQSSRLVDHYNERVSRSETLELQRQRRIPAHLNADQAYYYINALRLFLEYDQAANTFVKQGKGRSIVDFMLSAEAEPWYTLIEVFDRTVEVWLRARIDPLRAAGCQHLLNVGWNWMQFASLPANRLLDFQQYHNYVSLSLDGFNINVAQLEGLRRAFPDHPIILGEFGWSNETSSNPATSRHWPEQWTAIFEAATCAYLRANNFGGAFKWKLNDLDISHNPYEAAFGLYKVGNVAKPIRDILRRLSDAIKPVNAESAFRAIRDATSGLSYRFDVPQQVIVGGYSYQDGEISWRAQVEGGHCYLTRQAQELLLEANRAGELSVDPWKLLPGWDPARKTELYRVYSETQRTRQQIFEPGELVVFQLASGAKYAVTMGEPASTEPPDDGLPVIEPQPGEHLVLLADANQSFQAALNYIRRFAPDVSFAEQEVAGRWAFVTVVATPAQVSDKALEEMRSRGAVLVERVVGATPDATKTLLAGLVAKGRRFLSNAQPPQTEPPSDPEPPPSHEKVYVVQPGDSLSLIAKKVYGDYSLWPVIFEANRDKISDPSLIRVGMELLIPSRD